MSKEHRSNLTDNAGVLTFEGNGPFYLRRVSCFLEFVLANMPTSESIRLQLAGIQVASAGEHRVASARYQAQQRQRLVNGDQPPPPSRPAAPRTLQPSASGGWSIVEPNREPAAQKQKRNEPSALGAIGPVGMPALRSQPVFADEMGNLFTGRATADGMDAHPFAPAAAFDPAKFGNGGFLPTSGSTAKSQPTAIERMIGGAASQLPAAIANDWLTSAAANLMTGTLPGGSLSNVLDVLKSDGCFGTGSVDVLGSLMDSLGNTAIGQLSGMIPSLGSMVGGKLGPIIDALGVGKLPGQLAQEALGSLFGNPAETLKNLADQMSGFVEGGCLGNIAGAASDIDLSALSGQALQGIGNYLMSQWQVNDESSAAEHIAHMLVSKYQADMLAALQDPQAFLDRIDKLFNGVTSTAILPAARLSDSDNLVDVVATGLPPVLAESLPIARILDIMMPSGKPILEGAALVLSGGLPTARVTSATAVPSAIAKGAGTVLVGGPTFALPPPPLPKCADVASNEGPAGPAPATSPSGESPPSDVKGTPAKSEESQINPDSSRDSSGSGSPNIASDGESSTESDATDTSRDESEPWLTFADEGSQCKSEAWRDQLSEALQDPEQGVCWQDPTSRVLADDTVSEREHLSRNIYNYCPDQKPSAGVTDGIEWDPKYFDGYHKPLKCLEGIPVDGSLGAGSFECCYNPSNGELVDNAPQSGTFNISNGSGFNTPLGAFGDHGEYDVKPHDNNPNYDHVNMSFYDPPRPMPEMTPIPPPQPGPTPRDIRTPQAQPAPTPTTPPVTKPTPNSKSQ
jgi:uncharacterized Zn-binding protein involved in type VI secretion